MKTPDAHRLLKAVYNRYRERNINADISTLSRVCGLSYSTVYNPIMYDRKTNADVWMKLMLAMGGLIVRNGYLCVNLEKKELEAAKIKMGKR